MDASEQTVPPEPPELPDGSYDAFVVDARAEGDGPTDVMHLELTITAGDHKGEVLAVAATGLPGDELDLLGMPATLVITGGIPSVTIDA
jgi:hypothetical protein